MIDRESAVTMKALQLNPAALPISQTLLDKHFLRKHGPGAYYGQSGSGLLKLIDIRKMSYYSQTGLCCPCSPRSGISFSAVAQATPHFHLDTQSLLGNH